MTNAMTGPMTGKVQTVLGLIEPSEMGITLTHEHLLIDLAGYTVDAEEATLRGMWDKPWSMEMIGPFATLGYSNKDGLQLLSGDMALEEIRRFMLAGGGTVVDATDWDLGRDPLALARISRATGLNIVMGSGHYVPTFRPADMADRSEESITERLVRDISLGVGDTGIKSGLIGEIGNVHPSDDIQRKVLRASAQAQVETGAPILIHPGIEDTSSGEILDVLVAAGANPKHTIMGHLDYSVRDWGHLKALAETGCFLELDTFGYEITGTIEWGREVPIPTDAERIDTLEFLVDAGFGDQVTLAQDVCLKVMAATTGGKGYAHIVESIVPRMLARGFTQSQIDAFLIGNPARAMAFT
jgi:phosphotriesterase-related protein